MLFLSRYQDEASAGLFGFLLMIIAHIGLAVVVYLGSAVLKLEEIANLAWPLNPLSPLLYALQDKGGLIRGRMENLNLQASGLLGREVASTPESKWRGVAL